jgi:F-type H+-transporting ATPase subunit delta
MASSKVANRYAQSFLDTSIEKNILDTITKDFELVYQSLIKSPELLRAFKSPVIKTETKQSILAEIFGKLISKDSMDFLNFVILKGREELFADILEKFENLKDEHIGAVKIEVTTAFIFTEDQKNQLKDKFESHLKKTARLTFKVDQNIIGGFVAKVGDTVYNASMIHQLGLLKKQLLQEGITLN